MNRYLGFVLLVLLCGAVSAQAEDTYLSVKVGGFLPNGKGDASSQGGLKDFDTGYNTELAIGFKPAPYAAIEVASGFYSAEKQDTVNGTSTKATIYGVPVTVTAKAILSASKADFFAGAGAGYYFGVLDQSSPARDSSTHGNALGYHIVGGFDYNVSQRYSLGADIKWFSTKPEFDANNSGLKTEWELGGTTLNLGMKYKF